MKNWIIACCLPFVLAACGTGEYVHSSEPRSTVYYGQPVADLYENFGTPTKATRLGDNERVLIYTFQEIEREWAYRYVRGCVMKFYLMNERVVDWTAEGQACVIQSRSAADVAYVDKELGKPSLNDVDELKNLSDDVELLPDDSFDGAASTSNVQVRSINAPDNSFRGKASDSIGISGRLPADAFDGKASAIYTLPEAQEAQRVQGVHYINNGVQGMKQVPADAFGGTVSTQYHQDIQPKGTTSAPLGLPADAFDGNASRFYAPTAVQTTKTNSDAKNVSDETNMDEDEWGLFD